MSASSVLGSIVSCVGADFFFPESFCEKNLQGQVFFGGWGGGETTQISNRTSPNRTPISFLSDMKKSRWEVDLNAVCGAPFKKDNGMTNSYSKG